MNNSRIAGSRGATTVLIGGFLALSACQPMQEFTVVQGDNSAILGRVSTLLVGEGFKPISQFSPDPRTSGCRAVDNDGAFSKETHVRGANRSFSVTYLICDGHLRADLRSSEPDSGHDHYQGKLVDLLRHELDGEITAGQVIVKTKQYVTLGP
jgi:hypothetical protein